MHICGITGDVSIHVCNMQLADQTNWHIHHLRHVSFLYIGIIQTLLAIFKFVLIVVYHSPASVLQNIRNSSIIPVAPCTLAIIYHSQLDLSPPQTLASLNVVFYLSIFSQISLVLILMLPNCRHIA